MPSNLEDLPSQPQRYLKDLNQPGSTGGLPRYDGKGMAIDESKIKFSDTWASVLMDLVRGLAAVLVLLEHWRNIFFVDYFEIPAHRAYFAAPYLLTSAGHQAVVIFFVLSGYLISRSIFSMFGRHAWSWKVYLTHRLVRLWVVLIPGLLLCALWDQIGLSRQIAPALYGGANFNHLTPAIAPVHKLSVFFGNLFFLQTIRTPPFGSDGALWSLANEFWYYILFPLALISFRRHAKLPQRLLSISLLAFLTWFLPAQILGMGLIWLCGTALALAPTLRVGPRARVCATLLYTPILFLLAKKQHLSPAIDQYGDYLLAIATFFFLWILLSARTVVPHSAGVRCIRELSRFSYTLYIVHTPILILLVALVAGDNRWVPTPMHVLAALGILCFVVHYAYLVASLTEFRTDILRGWIERCFGIAPRDTSAIAAAPEPDIVIEKTSPGSPKPLIIG